MKKMKVQVFDTLEPGFHTALSFGSWKTAVFNDAIQWEEENIQYLQKHELSDEVFILLEGTCTLIISEETIPDTMYGIKLEKGKIYNIPKGVWHSHVLGKGTKMIVVENSDTVAENSPKVSLPHPIRLNQLLYKEAMNCVCK